MSKTTNLLLTTIITINVLLAYVIVKKTKKRRSQWCKTWLQRRQEGRGSLSLINTELKIEDRSAFRNFLRLNDAQFTKLLNLIEGDIKKQDTFMRDSISAKHRLNITLRFLATGESYRSLMYSMRVHESTISKIVPEVCRAIYNDLKQDYLKISTSKKEWLNVATDFDSRWNFPHCLGALDGRHITITAPTSSGSYYYNYKGRNSIVLLGLVNANYRFLYVNMGVNGRISDGGVFETCNLFKAIKEKALDLPEPRSLPGRNMEVPYVIISDDAFPLLDNLMKPFPQRGLNHMSRIFNYRLSRARRVVESAFGILANRWRVLLNPIHLSPEKVEIITLACIVLHNYLATENVNYVNLKTDDSLLNVSWQQICHQGANRSADNVRAIRDEFAAYFNSCGAVLWQEDAVMRGNI